MDWITILAVFFVQYHLHFQQSTPYQPHIYFTTY